MNYNKMDLKFLEKLNILSNPLKMFFPKKMIGIDVGTAGIKVVEIFMKSNVS
jgi:hypothetical protein